jgi:hypothetical protein
MGDNSAFPPTHLTIPLGPAYPSFQELSMLFISSGEDRMIIHVFVWFLVFLLLLSLAWLGRLYVPLQGLAHGRAGTLHPVVHRLLKPRTPRDCPACCQSSPRASGAGPSPRPVRPWSEVKSRRGAPKRINTEGFACPNQQCPYFGITEAHIHAAFRRWQAWAGRRHPNLSRSGLPQHVQCPTRHALVPAENPLSAGRHRAVCSGRRAGSFRG